MENLPNASDFSRTVTVTLVKKNGEQMDSFPVRSGSNLWVFIRKRGHAIGSACSGVGVCGACAVLVRNEQSELIVSDNAFEKSSLENQNKDSNSRLSCLFRVFENITVQAEYW